MKGTIKHSDSYRCKPNQALYGSAIGIVVMPVNYPAFPGNVANASTFDFPVTYKVLYGVEDEWLHTFDSRLKDKIIEAGQELSTQGCRALVGACGFFGNFQKVIASALDMPVYLSSLLQIPMILQGLTPQQTLGIITAEEALFNPYLLANCGVKEEDEARLVIKGALENGVTEFANISAGGSGQLDSYRLEVQLVGLATRIVSANPTIQAILLECSDMPPYAHSIQNAVRLPVFDYVSMINWISHGMVRREFDGFM